MQYAVYILVFVLYIGSLYPICFIWEWEGWLSYIAHIFVILLLTALILFIMGGLAIYFNIEKIIRFLYDVYLDLRAHLSIYKNPRNWFVENSSEMVKKKKEEMQLLRKQNNLISL